MNGNWWLGFEVTATPINIFSPRFHEKIATNFCACDASDVEQRLIFVFGLQSYKYISISLPSAIYADFSACILVGGACAASDNCDPSGIFFCTLPLASHILMKKDKKPHL